MIRLVRPLVFALAVVSGGLRASFSEGLVWDALAKEHVAKKGDTNALVTFHYTNQTAAPIRITDAKLSCHCTVLKEFTFPKTVPPGASGPLTVEVDILVKTGALRKTMAVETSAGTNVLSIVVKLPELDAREKNRLAAFVDRQAVFKGDCAQCHAAPTRGQAGEGLYRAACAICHEAEHRADMVPDLAALKTPADPNYWAQWVTVGKPGTFMPGFHKRYGGPLTDEQIASLLKYLPQRFPPVPGAKAALPLE
jgi:mono/diheme cytochrome c family protein